jgi:aspartyl/asparaginyl beta-hydroxylase (cupin superfamily)
MTPSSNDIKVLEAQADRALASRDLAGAQALLTRAVALPGGSPDLWMKLAAVRRSGADLQGALEALSGALSQDPRAFLPLLMRSAILAELGRTDEAGEMAAAAIFHAPPRDRLPPILLTEFDKATRLADEHREGQAVLFRHATAEFSERGDAAARARIDRFISNSVRATRAFAQEPTHFHFPGLPVVEFFGPRELPWLEELQAATPVIRAEFDALIAREAADIVPYVQYPADVPLAQWRALNHSRQWSAIHLLKSGEVVESNARHCPRTMALFGNFDQPHVPGRSPNLMFSLLAPGTRIPPHNGVTNTRLVVHLPLIVPPGCGFRVGGETREWRVGEAFAFDDTIEHEAWNDSAQLRVVLIGDVWRPELGEVERAAAAAVMSAGAP